MTSLSSLKYIGADSQLLACYCSTVLSRNDICLYGSVFALRHHCTCHFALRRSTNNLAYSFSHWNQFIQVYAGRQPHAMPTICTTVTTTTTTTTWKQQHEGKSFTGHSRPRTVPTKITIEDSQHVNDILGCYIARRPFGVWATAQSSNRRIDCGDTPFESDANVG
jgi:hypothetical protein